MTRTRTCVNRAAMAITVVSLAIVPACGKKESAPTPASGAAKPAVSPAAPVQTSPVSPPPAPAASAWKGFRPEDGPIVPGKAVSFASLSPTEQKYGVAPARGEGVVYQDQVQLIEHGDKAIKSAKGDGMTWTLDGSDPRVAALKEGDVVFATAYCVGRILKLARTGNDVEVILGPAQITDIIKKGNFAYEAPLDMNAFTAVEEPDFPGAFGSSTFAQMKQAAGGSAAAGAGSTGSGSDVVIDHVQYFVVSPHGVWRPMRTVSQQSSRTLAFADEAASAPRALRTSYSPQDQLRTFNNVLSASPCYLDCGGLGIKLTAHKEGLSIDISAVLKLEAPKFTFNFNIGGPGPQAQVTLSGGVGFVMTVDGQTDPAFTSNLNEIGAIPVDLNLPLLFGPLPLVLHYHQDLSLSSGFSAKTSILKARADLAVFGSLGFTYQDGNFVPGKMYAEPTVDPSREINGISMGINSIVVSLSQRLLMGLGVDGLAVGPYISLTTTATAVKQATEASQMMLPQRPIADCTQATLEMVSYGGIGASMPQVIVDAVNFFLKLAQVTPIKSNVTLAQFKEPLHVLPPTKYQLPKGCAGGGH